jgi:hypothetical protein
LKLRALEYDARVMTETKTLVGPSERSEWSPWKTVLSMAIGAALGAGVYGIAEVRHRHEQAEKLAHAQPLPAAAPIELRDDKVPAEKTEQAAAAAEPEKATAPVEPEDPKARALAARTAAEQALLDEARTQLDAKNAAAAQATLDHMQKRFAHGTLVQERELLRIEVYKARGQMPAAKRAARKFVKAYPDSSHLEELNALTKI